MPTTDIVSAARRIQFTGNGSAGPFAFSFQINANTEVLVLVDGVTKTLTTHYTVALSSSGAGSVSFTSGNFPTSSQTITLLSNMDLVRTSTYSTGNALTAASLESDFDNQIKFIQQVDEEVGRSLKVPASDPTALITTLPANADLKGKHLKFNATTGAPEPSDIASLLTIASNIDAAASNQTNINTVATAINNNQIPVTLDGLTDVTITSIQNNQILAYNASSSKFVNTTFSGGGGSGTTYSDGTGLTLSGTTFNVDASLTHVTSIGSLAGLTVGSGDLQITGHNASSAGLKLGSTLITATGAEINKLDGVTASTSEINILDGVTANSSEINQIASITDGTVAANKAVIVNTNKDITGFRNVTLTGELDAATLDVSGDVDIDGTLEADAITVDSQALNLFVQDTVGAMVTNNTETNVQVTFASNKLNFDATPADNSITLAKLEDITRGSIVYGDNTGATGALGIGVNQTVLTSNGTDPSWQTISISASNLTDNSVTVAKLADISRGSIIYGNNSGETATLSIGTNNSVLTSNGTDISWGDVSVGTSNLIDNSVTIAKLADISRGSIIYGNNSGETATLSIGTNNSVLKSNGTDISWGDISVGTSSLIDNSVTVAKLADISRGSIIYGNASAETATLTPGTNGQILQSNGTDISWQSLSVDGSSLTDNSVALTKIADLARGSIIYGNNSAASDELAIGGNGQVLTSNGTDISWQHIAATTNNLNDDIVTLAKMANITRGSIIIGDQSGNPAYLAAGSNTYVLTSNGTDISWQANAGSGGVNAFSDIAVSGQTTVSADSSSDSLTFVGGTNTTITTNATSDTITFASSLTVTDGELSQNNFTDALKTKLDNVEASANAYVISADLLDEDDLASDSATKVPSQQSVKAYVDANTGTTNLSATASGTSLNVESSTGTNVSLPAATTSAWGVMTDDDKTKLDSVATSANLYVHPDHSGEVTSTADGATVIADNIVDEANLKISNSPTNGYFLQAQSGNTGGLTWAEITASSDTTYSVKFDVNAGTSANANPRFSLTASTGSADSVHFTASGNISVSRASDDSVSFATTAIANLSEDSSPQLGGNLDIQANEITTSTSNGNLKLTPNGTGVVEVKGASGNDGAIQLNCSANSHGIKLKSPPHSAGASYTLTFPATDGSANQVLKTDGSGGLDWVDQTAGLSDGAVTTAKIADDAVTLAKMAGVTRGSIIYGDSSGNPAYLGIGSNGQVLKSDGTDLSWGTDVSGGSLADGSVTEAKLNIHNAPSGTDKYLKYSSNGMEWATVSSGSSGPTVTAIHSTTSPPSSPSAGDLFLRPSDLKLFVAYQDADSQIWWVGV